MPDSTRYIWLFFSFKGRIGRLVYFLANLLVGVVQLFPLYHILRVPEGSDEAARWGVVFLVVALATMWPYVALAVKRLHDLDRPGILAVSLFIPIVMFVAFVALCVMPGHEAPNRFGSGRDREN
ncbi:MAG: DUF805 domain-containing protein [Rhizobiaceae bacterium]|nr:DUF805 domain-containing protein [Rhizobiaceae bacterium]